MHASYDDIRDLINKAPQWWDENAVPRFCPFETDRCADIYADEAVLAEVACQGCDRRFAVLFTMSMVHRVASLHMKSRKLADDIRAKELHYGDPPNVGCCGAGPTMNSVPVRVLEYWHRNHAEFVSGGFVTDTARYMEWRREPSLEVDIKPDWAHDD